MKKILVALTLVLLFCNQIITLVVAAPLAVNEQCDHTYTVRPNDNLYKVASDCGVPVSTILELNPQVVLGGPIFPGQVLRLTDLAPANFLPTYTGYITTLGTIRLSISTIRAKSEDSVDVYVSGYPANTQIEFRIGKYGVVYNPVYQTQADSEGNASATIAIPSSAEVGESWIVLVQTVGEDPPTRIFSRLIHVVGTVNTQPNLNALNAAVTISRTQAEPGDSVVVHITGFPKNSDIDYRVGKYGNEYSVVYDGKVDENGNTSATIVIPLTAEKGQYWVVHVQTTSEVVGVDVNSPRILITD
jgi:hypothetical protein